MVQTPCLGVLLVHRINQFIQPRFSTNFPTTLFFSNLSPYLELNNFPLDTDSVPASNYAGSTRAGPWQSSPFPPAPNPSQHQSLFQWVSFSHEVANWSFSFSIIPFKEHPGLISFRMDWWDLLAVQGTLKSLLQHHSSKASILQCSAFSTVQLSHPYMTTGKTIALTRWTFAVIWPQKRRKSYHLKQHGRTLRALC